MFSFMGGVYPSTRSAPMRSPEVTPLPQLDYRSGPIKSIPVRLSLFLVLWAQASFAAHHFEHDIDDIGETCTICLQFERSDDVIPETHGYSPIVAPAASEYIGTSAVCYARPTTPYLSRASP